MEDLIQKTETVRKDFEIPADNMAALEERITKLNRRAKRLKCPLISFTKGESFLKPTQVLVGYDTDAYGNERPVTQEVMMKYYKVVVEGESPQIPGFTFIGTIDHLPTGKNVLRIIQGFTANERFREVKELCEHCNKIRRRKDTYIIQNDAGEQKQIGKNCLKDYTGHASPEKIALMAEWIAEAMEFASECSSFGGGQDRFAIDLEEHLAWGLFAIRKHGWVSGKMAFEFHTTSTNGHIGGMKSAFLKSKNKEDLYTDKDLETAKLIVQWVRGLDVEGNDYLQNLKAVMEMDYIEQRSTGLAVSAIPSYHRAMEKEMEAKKFLSQKNSKHIGTIGERLVFKVTVLSVNHVESQWSTMNIHRMITPEGNVLTAFSMPEDLEVGKEYEIKGTIKRHDVYKEISQTIINRAKIHVEKPKKTRKKEKSNEHHTA